MSGQGARYLKHDSFVEFVEDYFNEGQIDKIHLGDVQGKHRPVSQAVKAEAEEKTE
jgi:hypothetical protein